MVTKRKPRMASHSTTARKRRRTSRRHAASLVRQPTTIANVPADKPQGRRPSGRILIVGPGLADALSPETPAASLLSIDHLPLHQKVQTLQRVDQLTPGSPAFYVPFGPETRCDTFAHICYVIEPTQSTHPMPITGRGHNFPCPRNDFYDNYEHSQLVQSPIWR